MDLDDLPDEDFVPAVPAPADPGAADLEMLRITGARDVLRLPLGLRMELLTAEGTRVSIGMYNHATFNQDEWLVMVSLYEDRRASPELVPEWLERKARTKNSFKVYMDDRVELSADYTRNLQRREFPTCIGDVLDAWKLQLKRVLTELQEP